MDLCVETGIWILVGSLLVAVTLIVITSWHLLKGRRHQSDDTPVEDEGISLYIITSVAFAAPKALVFKDFGCRKMSVKEIYAATNNLSALNCIGQGVAGKHSDIVVSSCNAMLQVLISD
ncbi:hypothetical protein BHE74_00038016 [Ensete ventricosum]|nr:hypothetical protein GW17_00059032 [Ensete ventricosum]RWW55355.1 hypothetical protein BHE74_00038016 [Ensete ventricosum]RZS25311.1 hypothetical protein BHM03_00058494 [Ensete ventricosum]